MSKLALISRTYKLTQQHITRLQAQARQAQRSLSGQIRYLIDQEHRKQQQTRPEQKEGCVWFNYIIAKKPCYDKKDLTGF